MINMTHHHRIDMVSARLAIRLPFIATIFSGMRREITDTVLTAMVRGMCVRFNPTFLNSLNDDGLLFVCAHEAMHTALLHAYRIGGRVPRIFNVAADAVINRILVAAELPMPTNPDGTPMGVLLPWVTDEMDTEQVYIRLLHDSVDLHGGWGDSGDLESVGNEGGGEESEAEVKVFVSQAARSVFAAGDKSELIRRIIGVVKQADVDWRDELRFMLSDPARNDYSYRRFSRRFIGGGMYLPSLRSDDLGVLGVGVDTSGSMTSDQLARIQAELRAIIEDCAPERTVVVYCDACVNRVDTFEKGEDLSLMMCGGGGTDMREITKYFEAMEIPPAGVVIFSDLETPFPCIEPVYPLLWGGVGASPDTKPPVGRKVEVRV